MFEPCTKISHLKFEDESNDRFRLRFRSKADAESIKMNNKGGFKDYRLLPIVEKIDMMSGLGYRLPVFMRTRVGNDTRAATYRYWPWHGRIEQPSSKRDSSRFSRKN